MNKIEQLYELIWMSRPLMQATEALVERQLDGTGLTVRMRAILEVIVRHESLSVPEIANHIFINRQYVQVMVNETISEGFTQKKPNPRHRKSPLITLTPKGARLIKMVISSEREILAKLAAGFDAEAIGTAHDTLSDLLTVLQGTANRTPT